jgi:hypothetical protein
MGDVLAAPFGSTVHMTASVTASIGAHVEILVDGKMLTPDTDLSIHSTPQTISFDWPSDGKRHWIRANVRGAGGELLLVGNPVYING